MQPQLYILDEEGYVLAIHPVQCKQCLGAAYFWVRMDWIGEDDKLCDNYYCVKCGTNSLYIITYSGPFQEDTNDY